MYACKEKRFIFQEFLMMLQYPFHHIDLFSITYFNLASEVRSRNIG